MKKLQQGFTLIELMIVVAIIGILAAIAIPAYQDYTQRAQVGEAFTVVSAAKTAIEEYAQTNGEYPPQADIDALALDLVSPAGQYVDTVTVTTDTGVVTAVMKATGVGADIAQGTVVFTPPQDLSQTGMAGKSFTWVCTSPDVLQKYLPKSCTGI